MTKFEEVAQEYSEDTAKNGEPFPSDPLTKPCCFHTDDGAGGLISETCHETRPGARVCTGGIRTFNHQERRWFLLWICSHKIRASHYYCYR